MLESCSQPPKMRKGGNTYSCDVLQNNGDGPPRNGLRSAGLFLGHLPPDGRTDFIPVTNAELGKDVLDVPFHRFDAETKYLGDALVGDRAKTGGRRKGGCRAANEAPAKRAWLLILGRLSPPFNFELLCVAGARRSGGASSFPST